jgi:fimbrial chaperone protein
LQFEIRPKKWTQDEDGKDVYSDTEELLIFPGLMTLKGGEDRDIRIGMKIPPGASESTYRVFINELPPLQTENATAANVGFLINFGLPVFFAPIEPKAQLLIEDLSLVDGQVSARLLNSGNVFQFIQDMAIIGLDASGAEIFHRPISDRYLLTGTAKTYTTVIPADQCKAVAVIEYSVRTDKTSANENKNADEHACASKNPEPSPDKTLR